MISASKGAEMPGDTVLAEIEAEGSEIVGCASLESLAEGVHGLTKFGVKALATAFSIDVIGAGGKIKSGI